MSTSVKPQAIVTRFACLVLLCVPLWVAAQSGGIDLSFDPGSGVNGHILSTSVQSDGKIIIAGSFGEYDGTERRNIARLDQNGTLDPTFDPGSGTGSLITATAIQPDGKILIVGNFTTYNGTERNRIARLNPDGSLDISFDPGTGASGNILSTAIQADGKIIIAGYFGSYNGMNRNRIARLDPDGGLDAGFMPGTGANQYVRTISVQPDGKILIGGAFTSYNSTLRNRIARLNANGSLDTTFDPGSGADNDVTSIAVQTDGKIILAGSFTNYNGTDRVRIARLDPDGSLDDSFDTGSGADNVVMATVVQPDGKIIVAGHFTAYNDAGCNHIVQLNSDGSMDADFNPGTAANSSIACITLQQDGKIIIAGWFGDYDGTMRNGIARLNGTNPTTSIPVSQEEALTIFPNPTTTGVTVRTTEGGALLLLLRDVEGRLLRQERYMLLGDLSQNLPLSLEHIAPGTYLLELRSRTGSWDTRLIKQ